MRGVCDSFGEPRPPSLLLLSYLDAQSPTLHHPPRHPPPRLHLPLHRNRPLQAQEAQQVHPQAAPAQNCQPPHQGNRHLLRNTAHHTRIKHISQRYPTPRRTAQTWNWFSRGIRGNRLLGQKINRNFGLARRLVRSQVDSLLLSRSVSIVLHGEGLQNSRIVSGLQKFHGLGLSKQPEKISFFYILPKNFERRRQLSSENLPVLSEGRHHQLRFESWWKL